MYCIIHKGTIAGQHYTSYLAWQNPVWNDDGYFWASKEIAKEILCNNTKEHPFLFRNRKDAAVHLKSINIPQKCSIVRWTA